MAQDFLKWDVVNDSIKANESQIYSRVEMALAETFNADNTLSKIMDPENMAILINGKTKIKGFTFKGPTFWEFAYTMKILIKDHKIKILVYDARCIDEHFTHFPVSTIYPTNEKWITKYGFFQDEYFATMRTLRQDIQSKVDFILLKANENINGDW